MSTPIWTGDSHESLSCAWTLDDGTAVDITGATITFRWKLPDGTAQAGDGTVTVVSATGGTFTYAFGTNDLALVGQCQLQWKGVWADNSILHSDKHLLYFGTPI